MLLPYIIIAKTGYTRFGIPECVYYGFPSGQSARGPLDSEWNYVRRKANPLSQASRNVSFKWWAFFRFLLELIYRKKDHQGNMGNYLESVARYTHTRTDGDNMKKHSKQSRIQIFQIAWGE